MHVRKHFWGIIPRSGIAKSKQVHNLRSGNATISMAMVFTLCMNSEEHNRETLAKVMQGQCVKQEETPRKHKENKKKNSNIKKNIYICK